MYLLYIFIWFVGFGMTTYNTEAGVIACYISLLLAVVIATICGRCYVHIIQHEKMLFWLMLLPCISVVDVITTEADVIACYISFYFWLMLLPIYVADVIATSFGIMWWQMLLPSGRWNSHYRVGGCWVVDVITTGQMLLPWVYDGTRWKLVSSLNHVFCVGENLNLHIVIMFSYKEGIKVFIYTSGIFFTMLCSLIFHFKLI